MSSFLKLAQADVLDAPRRAFLERSGGLLSASAIALMAGCESLAAKNAMADDGSDARILNTALAAELEAVAAYQLGADSGLLQPATQRLALTFQGHHRAHADLLAATVRKLGGAPAQPKSDYGFPVERLKAQDDVLRFAAQLEKGAVSAYLGAVPVFEDRQLAKAAASILGDEAMHWAVLRHALGEEPVPVAFVA
ncbi:MAG: ferritin-like domain-containing protein [Burkholderiales bacterium]